MSKTYQIPEEFIIAAHEEACSGWKKKIEEQVPELFEKHAMLGDRVRIGTSEYIIGRDNNNEILLISLRDGNIWTYSQAVFDVYAITKEEMGRIIGDWDYTIQKCSSNRR
jgi:hypothetical protein